jgi:regulator of replication initiation timing
MGFLTRLKKLLGRLPWHEEDNVKRNLINDKLRARFGDSLFDLAAVESRIDETKKATFKEKGKDYELLRSAYTDDGGHLNSLGRQVAAIELLRTLAGLKGSKPESH